MAKSMALVYTNVRALLCLSQSWINDCMLRIEEMNSLRWKSCLSLVMSYTTPLLWVTICTTDYWFYQTRMKYSYSHKNRSWNSWKNGHSNYCEENWKYSKTFLAFSFCFCFFSSSFFSLLTNSALFVDEILTIFLSWSI